MKGDYLSMYVPVSRKTKYPTDAFYFVRRGLDYTVRRINDGNTDGEETHRHVSCRNLCMGLRDYGLEQYGLMAQTVLKRWNITSCEDFGHIVFAMVDAELIRKSDEDKLKDFQNVFSFDEAYNPPIVLECPVKTDE